MLPDYPKVKAELSRRLTEFLKARVRAHLGPLAEIPRYKVFEGGSHSLTRSSGESESTEFEEQSSEFVIRDDELPTLQLGSLLERLDEVAKDLARQMAESTYRKIADTVERVGNVVDAKGERFNAQMILDSLSSLNIEFGSDLKPRLPQIHIHPSMAEGLRLALEELESKPELRRQFKQIIEEKREEWRAREASRKLVG